MDSNTAAFFRVEGTLTSRSTVMAAGWLAANSQELTHRFTRLGAVALSAPFAFAGDPTLATRMAWLGLRGMSEDRLIVLGEEYWATYLKDALLPVGLDLLQRAKRDGRRIVLISDNLHEVVAPLAEQVNADHVFCNRMELRNNVATGRLREPVISRIGGSRLRDFADERGLDLHASCGYGASSSDSMMLSAVGMPCAVHPDRGLRRIARDLDWPVVEA